MTSNPKTPRADGSAVAAMLVCAKALSEFPLDQNLKNDCAFVAFNRADDGLLGSYDFVDNFLASSKQSDTPHTLDYEFLQKVTQVLVAKVLS